MTPHTASEILFSSINSGIARSAERTISVLRTGVPPTRRDPFTGRESPIRVSPDALTLAAKLAAAGLNSDDETLSAIRSLIADTAHAAFFNFFAALDGEGAIINEQGEQATLELRTSDGARLPTDLHDRYPHPLA